MTEYRFLRHASCGELRDLLALYREAQWVTQDECGAFLPGVLSGSFLFLAAFDSGRIIGMARALSDGVSDAYIQDVAVARSHRKQGIGRELVFRLKAELEKCGIEWIGLVGAPGTEKFYQQLGLKNPPDYTFYQL